MAKAILAKNLASLKRNDVIDTLLTIYDEFGDRVLLQFDRTTNTFETVDPEFLKELKQARGEISLKVGPKDDEDGLIWKFLEGGTSVRFVAMSEDFTPKTAVRRLDSVRGTGAAIRFTQEPLPGIEAREWRKVIIEEQLPLLQEAVNEGLADLLKGN